MIWRHKVLPFVSLSFFVASASSPGNDWTLYTLCTSTFTTVWREKRKRKKRERERKIPSSYPWVIESPVLKEESQEKEQETRDWPFILLLLLHLFFAHLLKTLHFLFIDDDDDGRYDEVKDSVDDDDAVARDENSGEGEAASDLESRITFNHCPEEWKRRRERSCCIIGISVWNNCMI